MTLLLTTTTTTTISTTTTCGMCIVGFSYSVESEESQVTKPVTKSYSDNFKFVPQKTDDPF
jgi:hypothetical protein